MQKLISRKSGRERSRLHASTYTTQILVFTLMLKTALLILYLLCGSYFLGMLWAIFSENSKGWLGSSEDFIGYFGIGKEGESNMKIVVTLTYFAFTSLSTVGLGDLHPRSNSERLVGAFVLLFGVALTSYIMESLA